MGCVSSKEHEGKSKNNKDGRPMSNSSSKRSRSTPPSEPQRVEPAAPIPVRPKTPDIKSDGSQVALAQRPKSPLPLSSGVGDSDAHATADHGLQLAPTRSDVSTAALDLSLPSPALTNKNRVKSKLAGPLPPMLQPHAAPAAPYVLEVPGAGIWLRFSFLTQRGYYPEAPDKANQDSFLVCPRLGGDPNDHLFGVFDGHGEHGTPCSQFARDRLAANLLQHHKLEEDPMAAFHDAFITTNKELHREPSIDDTMSGTTGIALLLRGNKLFTANVGDSRAVLAQRAPPGSASESGLVAVDLSSDQTPFRDDECARVKGCGARVMTLDQLEGLKDPNAKCWGGEEDDDGDPPRLWVQNGMYPGTAFTRSVGDTVAERIGVSAEPEVKELEIDPEQHPFFVVASDGVFEFLTSQNVVDMVAKVNDPHAACSGIVAESYRLWLQYETRTDDITIVVVHIDKEPQSTPNIDDLYKSSLHHPNHLQQHLLHKQQQQAQGQVEQEKEEELGEELLLSDPLLGWRSMLDDMAHAYRRPIEPMAVDWRPDALGTVSKEGEEAEEEELPKGLPEDLPEEERVALVRLELSLRSNVLFLQLGEECLRAAIACFHRHHLREGDVVIQQGELGDRFYVCDKGEYDVLVATEQEEDDPLGALVHRYTADEEATPSFGDLALLYPTRREASVRASSPSCSLWTLSRSRFRLLQALSSSSSSPSSSEDAVHALRVMRALPLLSPLSLVQMQRLATVAHVALLQHGEKMEIEADTIYMAEGGRIAEEAAAAAGGGEEEQGSETPWLRKLSDEVSEPSSGAPARNAAAAAAGAGGGGGGAHLTKQVSDNGRLGLEPPQCLGGECLVASGEGEGRANGEGMTSSSGSGGKRRRVGRVTAGRAGVGGVGGGGGGEEVGEMCVRVVWFSKAEFEGAVGCLADLQEWDQNLRTFQSLLRVERQRNLDTASLASVVSAEVEWQDTLSRNEFSELGSARIKSRGASLSVRRFSKSSVPLHPSALPRVLRERSLLSTLPPSPFVPQLLSPLQDEAHVALLLDCQLAAPLALIMEEPLPESCVKFVAASLVCALQFMHRDMVVFRGVAPGSVFLDTDGRVQLPDLRFAKRLLSASGRTYTLCGAPDYLAPEIISGAGHGQAADWWALGVLLFTMLHGDGPFGSWKDSELQVYTRIAQHDMSDYSPHVSPEAVSFIDQLLSPSPESRLGCGVGGAEGVKQHPWFSVGISWKDILNRKASPPSELLKRLEEVKEQREAMVEEERREGLTQGGGGTWSTGGADDQEQQQQAQPGETQWFDGW